MFLLKKRYFQKFWLKNKSVDQLAPRGGELLIWWRDMVPRDNPPKDNVPQDNPPRDNVPQDNPPWDNVPRRLT